MLLIQNNSLYIHLRRQIMIFFIIIIIIDFDLIKYQISYFLRKLSLALLSIYYSYLIIYLHSFLVLFTFKFSYYIYLVNFFSLVFLFGLYR